MQFRRLRDELRPRTIFPWLFPPLSSLRRCSAKHHRHLIGLRMKDWFKTLAKQQGSYDPAVGRLTCSSRLMVEQDDGSVLRRAFQRGGEIWSGVGGVGRRQVGDAGENQPSAVAFENRVIVLEHAHPHRRNGPSTRGSRRSIRGCPGSYTPSAARRSRSGSTSERRAARLPSIRSPVTTIRFAPRPLARSTTARAHAVKQAADMKIRQLQHRVAVEFGASPWMPISISFTGAPVTPDARRSRRGWRPRYRASNVCHPGTLTPPPWITPSRLASRRRATTACGASKMIAPNAQLKRMTTGRGSMSYSAG